MLGVLRYRDGQFHAPLRFLSVHAYYCCRHGTQWDACTATDCASLCGGTADPSKN